MKKLRDLTPKSQRQSCHTVGCPAIFESSDKHYIIVGELMDTKQLYINGRVLKNEVAIKVPKFIIDEMSY